MERIQDLISGLIHSSEHLHAAASQESRRSTHPSTFDTLTRALSLDDRVPTARCSQFVTIFGSR